MVATQDRLVQMGSSCLPEGASRVGKGISSVILIRDSDSPIMGDFAARVTFKDG